MIHSCVEEFEVLYGTSTLAWSTCAGIHFVCYHLLWNLFTSCSQDCLVSFLLYSLLYFSFQVLQDEFDSHKPQLDNLQDAARAILDKQDSSSRSRSPIQQQINEIQDKWDDLKKQLDEREGQIHDVLKESEPFHDTKQDLNDWLIDFGSRISSLPAISQNPEVVKQQREHTKVSLPI